MAETSCRASVDPLRKCRFGLGTILVVSAVLRIWLAANGGQWWWPDEVRFQTPVEIARVLVHGHFHLAFVLLFGSADHIGFRLLSVAPAFGYIAGLSASVIALFYGAFSLGNIYLVWRIARMVSHDEAVALWSAFFAAATTSLFYYSSHFFPYDPGLFFGLCCLVCGLKNSSTHSAWLAGICAGVGFLIYNGYWLFCGVTLALAILWRSTGIASFCRRVAAGAGGLLLPIALVVLLGRAAGNDLIASGVAFSKTIVIGAFAEGWTFALEYFFQAEGSLLGLWLLGLVLVLAGTFRHRQPALFAWAAAIVAIYLVLGAMSAVFHLFVIEARIVRCLAPFFALLCGGCTAELHRIGGVGRVLQWMVGGALVVFAGIHFIIPLRQWYPESFYAHAKEIAAIQPDGVRLLALNDHSTPTLVFPEEYPAEAILFSRPHPYQYAPFQYEGITPEVRRRYQTYDFPMQVVRVRSPVLRWTSAPGFDLGKYPGPLRLMLQLPHNGTGLGDPLVVTGFARGADWLTVLRDGPNSFRFQFRHWGDGVLVSEPITLDEQIEHTLVVSLGSMMPPGEAPIYRLHPELGILQQHLFLSVDQHIVFDQSQAFFPCKPVDIEVGHNSIDGTVTEVRFRGRIASVDGLPPTDVPRLFEAPASKIFVADLNSYPGPIRARLRLSGSGSDAEPLLATGSDGASDHLRLVHLGSNRFRVDFHHAGAPILSSSVIELDEMMEHSIEISLGSLMPPASSAVYQRKPETTLLRHWLFVAIDGRRIFDRDQSFHSTTTASIHFGRSVNGESPVLARGEERLVEVRPLPCAELLVKL